MVKNKKIFSLLPIVLAVFTLLSCCVELVANVREVGINITYYIFSNIPLLILGTGVIFYFISFLKGKSKNVGKDILLVYFIISVVSYLVSILYLFVGELEYEISITYLLFVYITRLIGNIGMYLYLDKIFNSKLNKITNKMFIISTILLILVYVVNWHIDLYVLLLISLVPHFYYRYYEIDKEIKPKEHKIINSKQKLLYRIITIISLILALVPCFIKNIWESANIISILEIEFLFFAVILLWLHYKKSALAFFVLYFIDIVISICKYINWGILDFNLIDVAFIGINIILASVIGILYYNIIKERNEKIKNIMRSKEMEEREIYKIDGNMGKTLIVYENRCVISITSSGKAFLFGGIMGATRGDKEFYYADITSIQFKNLSMTTGYLQFEYAGSISGNNYTSENSFTFSATIGSEKYKELQESMPPVYKYIQDKVREYKENKNNFNGSVSIADEIKKYKELLDMGAITQEEFEVKKKELLK